MHVVLMSPPDFAPRGQPGAVARAGMGRCGDRSHPSGGWVFFFNRVLCRGLGTCWARRGGDARAGVWGRSGGLYVAKPPQCLLVSQAPAWQDRGARAEPREMPINSLRISRSRLSVIRLGWRRGWRGASVCPAGLVSAPRHWGRSGAEAVV